MHAVGRTFLQRSIFVLAIAALGFALIWLNLAVGIASATRYYNPQIALDWLPSDARAQAKMADRVLQQSQDPDSVARARALAEGAVKRDPTVVSAIRNLGVIALLDSRSRRGERLMQLSQALSKRDLATQLWFIEKEVAENDVKGALRHFDIALRTTNSDGMLWPILIKATAESELIRPMADLLSGNPPWRELFMPQLIAHGPSVANLAQLSHYLRQKNSPLPDNLTGHLIRRLDEKAEYSAMSDVYRRARNLSDGEAAPLIRNGDFTADNRFPPLDWQLISTPGFSSRLAPRGKNGADLTLFFDARTGHGGEVASQRLLLAPGRYVISAEANLTSDRTDAPYLQLTCAETQATLVRGDLNPTGTSLEFAVPASCPAQTLSLQLRSTEEPQGVSGWADNFVIKRA